MIGNDHVTYNVAEKRYEMPFGHLMVYANVRKDTNRLYDLPPVSWTPGYATAVLDSYSTGE